MTFVKDSKAFLTKSHYFSTTCSASAVEMSKASISEVYAHQLFFVHLKKMLCTSQSRSLENGEKRMVVGVVV